MQKVYKQMGGIMNQALISNFPDTQREQVEKVVSDVNSLYKQEVVYIDNLAYDVHSRLISGFAVCLREDKQAVVNHFWRIYDGSR